MSEKPALSQWQRYVENTRDREPQPLLIEAIEHVRAKNEALDLGAGALNDTKYLLSQGFRHVTALDIEPAAQEIADALPADRFAYEIASLNDFVFMPGYYDLVNAQYALPFAAPGTLEGVFGKIKGSLTDSGIFVGQFFGDRDEWNAPQFKMSFVTEEEARELLKDLDILKFQEEEKEDIAIRGGTKHWHLFHVIARARRGA